MRRSLISALSGGVLDGEKRRFDPLESSEESQGTPMATPLTPPFNLPEPTPNSLAPLALNAPQSRATAGSMSKKNLQHQRHATSIPALHHGHGASTVDGRVSSVSVSVTGESSQLNLQQRGASSSIIEEEYEESQNHLQVHGIQSVDASYAGGQDETRQKRAASKSRPRWHSHSIANAVEANANQAEGQTLSARSHYIPEHKPGADGAVHGNVGGMAPVTTGPRIDYHLKRNLLVNGAAFLRFTEENNPQFVTLRFIASPSDPNVFTHALLTPISSAHNRGLSVTTSPNSSVIIGQTPNLAAAAASAQLPMPVPLTVTASNSAGTSIAASSSPASANSPSPPAQTVSPVSSVPRSLLSGALAVAGASLPSTARGSQTGALLAAGLPPIARTTSPAKPQLALQPRVQVKDLPASNQFNFQITPPSAHTLPRSPSSPTTEVLSIPLWCILNVRLGYKSKRFKKAEPHEELEHASFTIVYRNAVKAGKGVDEEMKNNGKAPKVKKSYIHLTAVQNVNYDVWVSALNVIHDENSSGKDALVSLQKILPVEQQEPTTSLARFSTSYLSLIYSLYHELQPHSNPPSAAASPVNLSPPPPLPNRRTSKLYAAKKEEILSAPFAHNQNAAPAVAPAALGASSSFAITSASRPPDVQQQSSAVSTEGGADAAAVSSVNSAFSSVANPPVNRHSISGTEMMNTANAAAAAANGIAGPTAAGMMRVDVLPFLRRGAYFLKFSKFGKPRFYFYRLSEDNYTLSRYDTESDIADRGPNKCIDIRNFDKVVKGQTTKRFKSAPVQLYSVSFSILVLGDGEDISLIAASSNEYAYWTQGLTALINMARQYSLPKSANSSKEPVSSNLAIVTLSPHTRGRLSMSAFASTCLHVKEVCIDMDTAAFAKNVSTDWTLCTAIDKKSLKRMRDINGIVLNDVLRKSDDDVDDDD